MQDEKYVNYYIETLTSTMTDCVVRNVSMQANMRVKDDIIKQQADKIGEFAQVNEELYNEVEDLKNKITETESAKVQSLNKELVQKGNVISEMNSNHQAAIKKMQDEIRVLNSIKTEYEKIKNQVSHVETFRTQLMKEREEHQKTRESLEGALNEKTISYEAKIAELNTQIDSLQTPVKKKKVKKVDAAEVSIDNFVADNSIKDGGEF